LRNFSDIVAEKSIYHLKSVSEFNADKIADIK